MSEQNKEIVCRWLEEAVSTKNDDIIDSLLASDDRLDRPGEEVPGIGEATDLVRL